MGSQDASHTDDSMNNQKTKGKDKEKVVYGTSKCKTNRPKASHTDDSIDNRKSETKGKDKEKVVYGTKKCKTKGPKAVKFNDLGQPIGKKAAPLAHFLSKSITGFVALTTPNLYKALNKDYKDQIWEHVQKHYIVDDSHRKLCFQKMAKYWREHKSKVIKKIEFGVKKESVEVVARKTRPANVHSLADWIKFVKFSLSPEEVKRRNYFKELRKKNTLKYRKSKKSIACLAHEMKKKSENPDDVTRPVVWIEAFSRKKKDGDKDVEDPEVVRQVKEKVAEQTDSSQWSINDDPVSQVLGPERRGRVRGYGFGVTPSKLIGRVHGDSKVKMLEKKLQDLELKFDAYVSRQNKGDNSSENSNIAIPPIHTENSMDDIVPQKRKEVPSVSTSSKRVKISKGEKQSKLVENASKKTPQMQHVLLLRWYGKEEKIVAFGDLSSKDPNDKVHCIPLGAGVWKVWVREVIEDINLYRPTDEFETLFAAKGSTIAWPCDYIKLL